MKPKKESTVIAIIAADLHWSEDAPISRSAEPNWLNTQKEQMRQLRDLQIHYGKPPIFVAGDLFHKWKSSPLLISNVLSWLYGMEVFAIPGNHDLPEHDYLQLCKSAYWTLVEAGAIHHLIPGGTHSFGSLVIHPFPHGFEVIKPNRDKHDLCLHVALIHQYIWTKATGHEGANEDSRSKVWERRLAGYDSAFFGDNHKGFHLKLTEESQKAESPKHIFNCGTFICRNSDEKDYKPRVGLLYEDGSVEKWFFLGKENERWLEMDGVVGGLEESLQMDLSGFAEELADLQAEKMDFIRVVLRWAERNKVPAAVMQCLVRAMGVKQK